MLGKILVQEVQIKSVIINLSKFVDHAVRVKLNLRWFNILQAIHFSQ